MPVRRLSLVDLGCRVVTEEPQSRPHPLDRHLWQITAVRDVIGLLLIFFFIWAGYNLRSIFTPVLIGLLFGVLI